MLSITLAILISILGLVLHWLKKWCRTETCNNFYEYLVQNPKHTCSSVITIIFATFAIFDGQLVDLLNRDTILLLLTTGYSIDSTINKQGD